MKKPDSLFSIATILSVSVFPKHIILITAHHTEWKGLIEEVRKMKITVNSTGRDMLLQRNGIDSLSLCKETADAVNDWLKGKV
ncbi:MAG: hypothetical protein WCV85_04435 [Patescibacteria group bacterium]